MKKIIASLLVGAMTMSLVACGAAEAPAAPAADAATEAAEEAVEEAVEEVISEEE